MRQLAAVALLALVLAGCSAQPEPGPLPQPSSASAAPSGAVDADPGADAELAAFRAALEGGSPVEAEALVDAVEAAGFERSTIERTREVDSLGAPVTLLQIAVRVDGGCLVGDVGEGGSGAVRAPALGGGRCLVGEIVTVD